MSDEVVDKWQLHPRADLRPISRNFFNPISLHLHLAGKVVQLNNRILLSWRQQKQFQENVLRERGGGQRKACLVLVVFNWFGLI